QEALVEGVLTEIRVEVPLERFERLGEVEAVPHHVAQHGDVRDLARLQARGELRLDALVAVEDLHLDVDLVLCLVERVDVLLEDLGVQRRVRAPDDDAAAVAELVRRHAAGLIEDEALGVPEAEAAAEQRGPGGQQARAEQLPTSRAGAGGALGGTLAVTEGCHGSPWWDGARFSGRCRRPLRSARRRCSAARTGRRAASAARR